MEENKGQKLEIKIKGRGFLHEYWGMDGIYLLKIENGILREIGEIAYKAGYRPGEDVDYYIVVRQKKSADS